jgi:catechol 2,3-dioxygenase-like lactoylglutathione lyase family enzyme
MIEVEDVIGWSDAITSKFVRLGDRRIDLGVRDLRRAVEFYSRVFGFRAIDGGPDGAPVSTVTMVRARAKLFLCTDRDDDAEQSPSRRWAFLVGDIDKARETVWELGVAVARDSGAPDHIYNRPTGRSLYILDRDANEVELFAAKTTVPISCGPSFLGERRSLSASRRSYTIVAHTPRFE